MKFISLILIFAIVCATSVASPRLRVSASNKFEPSEKSWKFADKMLKKMSVDEKVGQLVHIGINARYYNQDAAEYIELKRQIVDNKLGGIVLFGAPIYESVHLVNRMQEAAKTPLLISLDAETGIGMRFTDVENFPWNMAMAATGNPELARRAGVITGREARGMGILQVYAPVFDVNNNADNPVINVRSFGENPIEVGRFGVAFMEGIQSQKVIATGKHFPGHGDTNVDSHRGLPIIDVSRQRLDSVELPPFKQAINAGIASIMVAHIGLPQIDPTEIKPLKTSIQGDAEEGAEIVTEKATMPATLSPIIQTELLRKELGFKGLIVSDAMSMSGLTLYFDQDEAAVRAFLAGIDILEKPADVDLTIKGLRNAVNSGRISESRLNESVRRIMAWKHEVGLMKNKITPIESIDSILSSKESRQLGVEIAQKAITLVKHDNKLLPLQRDKKVAVLCITNGEDRGFVGLPFVGTLRANGIKVERIVLDERASEKEIADAIEKVRASDLVIAGLFARVRSGAKNSIGIPLSGERVLRVAFENNKQTVGVSFGNPYFLRDIPQFQTYVASYGDMATLQRATANALVGKQDFVGKLPVTIGNYKYGTGLNLK